MDLAFTRRRFISALSSMLASLRLLRYRAFFNTRRTQDDLPTLQEYKRANTQAIWFEDPAKHGRMHCPWAMDAWEQWCLAADRLSAWR